MKKILILSVSVLIFACNARANIDLATLPDRDEVQVTIYNSADLTLVQESRALTLKTGLNKLQFSWANTLIDPTSIEMIPLAHNDKIDILDLVYPARTQNMGLWRIQSGLSGKAPVRIRYLTSGLSWRAFYIGTMAGDEKTMRLQGYVRVTNMSGEDYENATTRLIVGKVNILDQIANLARREYPYGRPDLVRPQSSATPIRTEESFLRKRGLDELAMAYAGAVDKKEIIKEGLSEYFLYTIEGKETIPNGWSKRLPSFEAGEVPIVNLYKYEAERYGASVVRFLSFKNDKTHKLGDTPIPGGDIRVFRTLNKADNLAYEGSSAFKYIPVDQDVELNLGVVDNVIVEPKLMNFETDNYRFSSAGDINGWDEKREFKIEVKNTRDVPVKVEITRNFNTRFWALKHSGVEGKYTKVDLDTVKFELELQPRSAQEFRYELTTRHGTRED